MTPLEWRYRQLITAYPPAHRDAYGEEMVAVLMDSAHPTQQRPSLRDAVLLLSHGILTRLRHWRRPPEPTGGRFGPEWTVAASVFTLVGAALLAARNGYWLTADAHLGVTMTYAAVRSPTGHLVLTVGWALTTLAVLLRAPRLAALLAVASGVGELLDSGQLGLLEPTRALLVTSAALVVAAAVTGRRERLRLRWSPLAVVVATTAIALSGGVQRFPLGSWTSVMGHAVSRATLIAAVGLPLAAVWLLVSVPAPVRSRLLVLALPVPAQALAYALCYDEWAWPSQHDRLAPLSLVGPAVLAVGLLVLRSVEWLRLPVTVDRPSTHEPVAS